MSLIRIPPTPLSIRIAMAEHLAKYPRYFIPPSDSILSDDEKTILRKSRIETEIREYFRTRSLPPLTGAENRILLRSGRHFEVLNAAFFSPHVHSHLASSLSIISNPRDAFIIHTGFIRGSPASPFRAMERSINSAFAYPRASTMTLVNSPWRPLISDVSGLLVANRILTGGRIIRPSTIVVNRRTGAEDLANRLRSPQGDVLAEHASKIALDDLPA